jgi:diacylglycerol kinase (ATP)
MTASSHDRNEFKGKTGLLRLVNATRYSIAGLRTAFQEEQAFRQILYCALIGTPLAALIAQEWTHFALLFASLIIPLIVELLNSAIENTVDRISLEKHELSKKAKDLGSAAQIVAQFFVATIWLSYIYSILFQ